MGARYHAAWAIGLLCAVLLLPGGRPSPARAALSTPATTRATPATSATARPHTPVAPPALPPLRPTVTPTTMPPRPLTTVTPATVPARSTTTVTPARPGAPSYLLYTTAHGLWASRWPGGAPRLIARGGGQPTARLSADGRYVLYAFPSSLTVAGLPAAVGWRQLFICRADGSGARVVVSMPVSAYGAAFAWSTDERHFLYVRVRVTGRPHGTGATPAWPWELRAVTVLPAAATTIWTGRLDRYTPVPLAWRRDLGIAYVADRLEGGFASRYAQVDTATGAARLTPLLETLTANLSASPRQYYLAVTRWQNHRRNIVAGIYPIGSPNGGVTGHVFTHGGFVGAPHWSPVAGNVVYGVYQTTKAGAPSAVSVRLLSLTLGRDRQVGAAPPGSDVLGWSPDGRNALVRAPTARGRRLYLLDTTATAGQRALRSTGWGQAAAEGYVGWGVGR